MWALVRLVGGAHRAVEGQHAGRSPPTWVPILSMNWVCKPPEAMERWAPTLMEWQVIEAEGRGWHRKST